MTRQRSPRDERRMNADEERSFRDFVAARGPALMRLGYLLTGGDQHAAEDLVQSALGKALPRWGGIEAPEAYLRRRGAGRDRWHRAQHGPPRPCPAPHPDAGADRLAADRGGHPMNDTVLAE